MFDSTMKHYELTLLLVLNLCCFIIALSAAFVEELFQIILGVVPTILCIFPPCSLWYFFFFEIGNVKYKTCSLWYLQANMYNPGQKAFSPSLLVIPQQLFHFVANDITISIWNGHCKKYNFKHNKWIIPITSQQKAASVLLTTL